MKQLVFHSIKILLLIFLFCGNIEAQSSKKAIKSFKTAETAFFDKDYELARKEIEKSLAADPQFASAWALQGDIAFADKDYEKAIQAYEKALSLEPTINVDANLAIASFRAESKNAPVVFAPQNLGSNVNTSDDEYINMVLFDGSKLLLTKRTHHESGHDTECLFQSEWNGEAWQKQVPFPLPYIENDGIGAAYCSPLANTMFFSLNESSRHGSRDIYQTQCLDGKWQMAQKVNGINTSSWESHPCISADGKELFFSRRANGFAQIYYAHRNSAEDDWETPIRLDTSINLPRSNQMAPFLHYDGTTLYFSSDRALGMGGYDIFMSQRNANGQWSEPVNLGYPINTEQDEINFYVAPDGKTAFISSQRDGGFGGYDIYTFELNESLRPEAVTYFDGEIVELDVYPEEINPGDTLTIRNIQFEFNSAALTKDSKAGIEKIAELLQSHPEFNAELAGHTDNVGNESYNLKLSTDRANAVRDALINIGVKSDRLTAKGYGSSQPLVPNDSEENRAKNRRTELIIMK